MGRKTFESLGNKPLGGRKNIIITRQKNFTAPHVTIVNSIEEAIQLAGEWQYKELFVLGGGEIYKHAIDMADKIYLTRVQAVLDADTYFPVIDETQWQLIFDEHHEADAKHAYAYNFQIWNKIIR